MSQIIKQLSENVSGSVSRADSSQQCLLFMFILYHDEKVLHIPKNKNLAFSFSILQGWFY